MKEELSKDQHSIENSAESKQDNAEVVETTLDVSAKGEAAAPGAAALAANGEAEGAAEVGRRAASGQGAKHEALADEPQTAAASPRAGQLPAPAARQTVAWWALLLALLAAGAGGWSVWQTHTAQGEGEELKETLARRLGESESTANEVRTIARQQQELIARLQGKLGALEAKLEHAEGQAASLENMYQECSRSRDARLVAEIQQAVTLAAQQLQLAGNVEAALVALNHADARLASHDKGQFGPLRRAMAKDIESLKLLQVVDIPGLGLRLESLLGRADRLPLSFETELPEAAALKLPSPIEEVAPPSDEDNWYGESLALARRFSSDLWQEVSSLVRLERLDQVDPTLLSPSQSIFLRENFKVRLLTARLALLSHDERSYAADLGEAITLLERFFDADNELVRATVAELTELKQVKLERELPTLTETFAALRMLDGAADSGLLPSTRSAGADKQQ